MLSAASYPPRKKRMDGAPTVPEREGYTPQKGWAPRHGWDYFSDLYAEAASGDVAIYAGSYAGAAPEAAANSVFWTTEITALQGNAAVTATTWIPVP